jgi:photosystem II stability/assembly factor-like uncharacterized protein
VINAQLNWKQTNGPYGGALNYLAVDKHKRMYVSGSGGLYSSTNQGISWERIDLGDLDTENVLNIITHPSGKVFVLGTFGLIESDTNGTNWKSKNMFPWHLTLDSKGRLYSDKGKEGIYISEDLGYTWKYIGLKDYYIQSLSFIGNNILVAGTLGGIIISEDQGNNWTFLRLYRNDMLYKCVTDEHNYIYAYVPAEKKVNRSKDLGKSWETFLTPSTGDIVVSKDGNNLIRHFVSSDQGITWKSDAIFSSGFASIQEVDGNYFGLGTNGVFRYDSRDNIWITSSNGINLTAITSVILKDKYSFATNRFGELFRSSDLGNNWEKLKGPNSRDDIGTLIDSENENIYVRPSYFYNNSNPDYSNIYRSSDYGNTWSLLVGNMWGETVISPDEEFFAATSGDDISFKYRLDPYSSSLPSLPRNVSSIAFDKSDNLYYSISNILHKYSAKTGQEGEPKAFNSAILSIKITQSDELFVATQNDLYIFQNNTSTSVKIPDLQNVHFKLFVQNNNLFIIDDYVYGIGRDQVLLYFDREKNSLINIFPKNIFTNITCVGMNRTDEILLGTWSRGILFTSISSVNKPSRIPDEFSLSQNYPNPFNPSTTIKYSIPIVETRHGATPIVLLKIYDVLGREITTLVNEEKAPGNYEVVFNGANLSSGVYFYKMSCGNFSETKKLVFMK